MMHFSNANPHLEHTGEHQIEDEIIEDEII